MSNEVATVDLPVSLKELNAGNALATDKMFGEIAKGASYLCRLQLFTAGSKECKAGRFAMNHYGYVISKEKITDLGKTVDIFPLSWRPKALQILPTGDILSKYDPTDPEFKRIAETSEQPNSGCMYGPEFLVWVPAIKQFASFFMSSKSMRIEAPNLKEKLDEERAATLDSVFVETKKYSWQTPVVKPCSTPFEVPDAETIIAAVTKFKNPPKDEIEAAEPAETARPR